MADLDLPAALAERLAVVRAHHPAVDAAALEQVLAVVVSAISADASARQATLLREVEGLGRTIADARAEIAALGVAEIAGQHIPTASDELDAVVCYTAGAADTILAACETLDAVAEGLNEPAASRLQAATTAIYEACSFQDITGQRITKVVAALKAIDARVARIVEAGQCSAGSLALSPEALMSGPQLPRDAMDQADVDQLLASAG